VVPVDDLTPDTLLWHMVGQPMLAAIGAATVLLTVILAIASRVNTIRERRRLRALRRLTAEEQLRAELDHLGDERTAELLDGYADQVALAALAEALRTQAAVRMVRDPDTEVTLTLPLVQEGVR
jgi:C4-dicarboxylate-specific signal transduction histidine kinase